MEVINGILCALLALLCYISPSEGKSQQQHINELVITKCIL